MANYIIRILKASGAPQVESCSTELLGTQYEARVELDDDNREWVVVLNVPTKVVFHCIEDAGWIVKCQMVPPRVENHWEQRFKALERDMRGTLITLEEARKNAREWELKYTALRSGLENLIPR